MERRLINIMIKMMIVDSNINNISYFKTFIKEYYPRMKVIASLSEANKEKFLELINNKAPRFIIMDIRFFAFLSLRIIEEICENYPKVKIIVTGEHSDYDYMKKSIEFGVVDFLFKPIKSRELSQCLDRAIEVCGKMDESEKFEENSTQLYNENLLVFKKIFLNNLISGVLQDEVEIKNSLDYFNIKLKSPYLIAVVGVDNFEDIIAENNEAGKHILIFKIFQIVDNYLAERNIGISTITNFNTLHCIMSGLDDLKEIFDVFLKIKSEVRDRVGISITIGLGRAKDRTSKIHISAREAKAALRHRYLMGFNAIIPIEFAEQNNEITYKYPIEKEQALVYSVVSGDYIYSRRLISQIFDSLDVDDLPERLLSKIVMGIIIAISRYASERDIDIEPRFREFFDFAHILQLRTVEESKSYLEKSLEAFCNFIYELHQENDLKLLNSAKKHIQEYYATHILLEELAWNLKTTTDILTRIFIKHLGMNIKEYITKLRVSKAKELMQNEGILSDEILSSLIGYSDVRHFRNVFKRYEGILPSEYRELPSSFVEI